MLLSSSSQGPVWLGVNIGSPVAGDKKLFGASINKRASVCVTRVYELPFISIKICIKCWTNKWMKFNCSPSTKIGSKACIPKRCVLVHGLKRLDDLPLLAQEYPKLEFRYFV